MYGTTNLSNNIYSYIYRSSELYTAFFDRDCTANSTLRDPETSPGLAFTGFCTIRLLITPGALLTIIGDLKYHFNRPKQRFFTVVLADPRLCIYICIYSSGTMSFRIKNNSMSKKKTTKKAVKKTEAKKKVEFLSKEWRDKEKNKAFLFRCSPNFRALLKQMCKDIKPGNYSWYSYKESEMIYDAVIEKAIKNGVITEQERSLI